MNRRIGLVAAGLVLLVAAVIAGVVLARDEPAREGGAGASLPDASAEERGRAPELAGEDPITGETVRLADFRGKPVVVNIWASWCPGCIEEAEDLRRFAAAHPEAVVLGIDFNDTAVGARDFYRRYGWKHPSIFDPSGELAGRLGLVGMPTTYFLDSEHRIAHTIVGATTRAGFEDGLARAKQAT